MVRDFADLEVVTRGDAERAVLVAARPYEQKFGITFSRFLVLPKDVVNKLHCKEEPPLMDDRLVIASQSDAEMLRIFPTLTDVANVAEVSAEARRRYFEALLEIYRRLPKQPR